MTRRYDRLTGEEIIFRPYITLRDGTRLWAKQCGKKAFPVRVRSLQSQESIFDEE